MAAKHLQDKATLYNGINMPWFGLGVFKVEEGVGQGIRKGLEAAGIKRGDLFVTSKVWNADLGYESTLKAYEESLWKLGLEYLDLYLIHWPVVGKYIEVWNALEALYKEGRVKAIGVEQLPGPSYGAVNEGYGNQTDGESGGSSEDCSQVS